MAISSGTMRDRNSPEAQAEAVRNEVSGMTKQALDAGAEMGAAALNRAKSNIDGMVATGQEAATAVREVGDNVAHAIDESLKKRPYTTLALAAGLGFLFGATWRR
jgi:ElaB/YqjD/DUF883 family membrane-anchored ribosome-binding protein